MLGDPTPLLLVLGTALLASLLRERNDWSLVVLAAAPLGLIYALILLAMLHEPMVVLANELQGMMPKVLGELGKDLSEADMARLQSLMLPILAGLTGAVHAVLTLASLILARAWQARLFNPGGFREEFHQLRLKPWMAVSLLLLVFVAPQFGDMAVVAPVSTVPLLLAGLALIHGIVGIKQLSLAWLIAMYVALLFASQAAVPLIMLLAFIDSLFDFRSRLKPENGLGGDDESNGQG
jgi:succinate dehydrogenase hydrophobic anchor subunit